MCTLNVKKQKNLFSAKMSLSLGQDNPRNDSCYKFSASEIV